ncbi:hypothetical protein ACFSKI_15275 [Pseudogracilibacillus auburnensis]|uniref:Uncharacterized protein n=1 Tax=Pseudogracilibacillus auburnensis TaxID=1494959 RepID=A0A2V3VNR6_9BACI|nr:hypothetical protein [Pseudogracilibacillus auburnensis]PXW82501.1 hypothetical protein DFR56_11878 [Pseudogracilibacillus auburnensis]
MKKISLVVLVTLLSVFLVNSETTFASENYDNSEDYGNYIELDDQSYRVVFEEEVILDYMKKENTDRTTAKEALGITDSVNALASCTTQWRHYTSSKKKIEMGVYLTLSPYVRVQNCSGNESFLSISSARPGYAFSGTLSKWAHLTTAGAVRSSNKRIELHASGYMKDLTTRYWNYSNCIRAKTSKGSAGCF